jgi:hypothetical protein
MASIFTEKALLHEPGVREDHVYVKTYDICIAYQTMKTAILDVYVNRVDANKYYGIPKMFKETIEETFTLNKKYILELLEERLKNTKNPAIYSSFYSMSEKIDYKTLMDNFSLYLNN